MGQLQSTLKLTLLDQVSARAKLINRSLDGLTRHTNGLLAMSRNIAILGATYLSVTEGIDKTYTAASNMQAGLTEIGIKAGLSNQHLEAMQRQLTALSPRVNQTTADLLSGVDAMVTLGLATDKAQASIPAIAKAATATGASIADLAGASTSAMQNMGIAPEQIRKMLDAMALAGNAGAFELKDMASYFPQLTASAQALGIDGVDGVADLAAALQIARRGAGDASTAANNLANFMGKIMSPEVTKNFKKFGIDVTKELKKAHKQGISPIEHFIKLVDEKTNGGQADLLGQLFGDKQVQDFVRPMIKDLKDYIRIREDAERANGTVDDAFAKRMEDNAQKVKAFKIALENLGTSIGGTMLQPVADFAERMSGILGTLGERVTVFDKLQTPFDGFLHGLGAGGLDGFADTMERVIFGVRDGSKAADEMGAMFARFEGYGKKVREFGDAVANNPITKFLSELSPYAFDALKISLGLAILAGTVRKLAGALMLLSGASAILGVLKSLGALGSLAGIPGLDGKTPPGGKTTSKTPDVPLAGWFGRMGTWLKGLGVSSMIGATPSLLDGTPGDTFADQVENQRKMQDGLRKLLGMKPWQEEYGQKRFIGPMRPERMADPGGYDMAGRAAYANSPAGVAESAVARAMTKLRMTGTEEHPGKMRDDHGFGAGPPVRTIFDSIRGLFGSSTTQPASSKIVATIDGASIAAMVTPRGVQQVQEVNRQTPNVTVNASFTITGVMDPQAAANSAASQLGEKVKSAVESTNTD